MMTKFKWGKYLLPEGDEILFYRDVLCLNRKDLIPCSQIQKVCNRFNINVAFYPEDKNLKSEYKLGFINVTSQNDSDKPDTSSLIRHLRNAFCHQNIYVDGDNCYLRDSIKDSGSGRDKPKIQTTMVGYVNYNDLKNLIKSLQK